MNNNGTINLYELIERVKIDFYEKFYNFTI